MGTLARCLLLNYTVCGPSHSRGYTGEMKAIGSEAGGRMRITLELPDDVAEGLATDKRDLPRAALEAIALEGYRSGTLSQAQVRRLLGYETSAEVDGFFKQHGVWLEYTLDDLKRDHETLRRLQP